MKQTTGISGCSFGFLTVIHF